MLFSDAAILVWTKKYMLLFGGHFSDSHRMREFFEVQDFVCSWAKNSIRLESK